MVEALAWRHKVEVVRQSLVGELGNDRARSEIDVSRPPCFLGNIDKLDKWARGDGSGDVSTAASIVTDGGFFWMHSANWKLASGGETLDHFPIDQQLAFAAVYDGVAHRQVDIEKAADSFERIGSLVPLADDRQGKRGLRAALGSLKGRINALTDNGNYMRRHFDAVGAKPDDRDFAVEAREQPCKPAAAAAAVR